MEVWAQTDPGLVRKQNQDYYLTGQLFPGCTAAVVCDGMGGAKSGNVASKLAATAFFDELKRAMRPQMREENIAQVIQQAVHMANSSVYENAQLSEDMQGMGTTLVAVIVQEQVAYFANVGDSRAYFLNQEGVHQITVDHSLVEMMVRRGELTREQAKTYPSKNLITRAVGTEPKVVCDLFRLPVRQGDFLLLCTDGVSNLLADQELLFEVVHGVRKQECCQRLINIVKERGAPDNLTAVLLAI